MSADDARHKAARKQRPVEPELDHGDHPIDWGEIDRDARERPLRVRRRRRGRNVSDVEHFDPRADS